jgi:hypothetical protein
MHDHEWRFLSLIVDVPDYFCGFHSGYFGGFRSDHFCVFHPYYFCVFRSDYFCGFHPYLGFPTKIASLGSGEDPSLIPTMILTRTLMQQLR